VSRPTGYSLGREFMLPPRSRCVTRTRRKATPSPNGARKALTAILENEGLRPTTRGEHLAVSEAVRAQLDPPMGRILRQFNRMRTRRHDAEYPPTDSPEITPDNVREDQGTAVGLIDLATRLLEEMSPF
jgi:hypothetical protein